MKINRILLLTDGIYPYVMGGMQKHSYFLAKHFTLSGVHVELAHCSNENLVNDELSREEFDSFNKTNINITYFKFPKIDSFPGHYIRESKKYSENLFSYYQTKLTSYDAIYAQGFTAWAFLNKKNIPPVFTNFHGLEMFQKAPSIRVKIEHLLLQKTVKEIIFKSDFVYSFGGVISDILKRLNLSNTKIIQSPIGIEEDWLNEGVLKVDAVLQFVFIGRYERRKGIEELNEAILSLPNSFQAKFHFIGPIENDKKISDQRVKYHGAIYDPEKIKIILKKSDVLICPSYSEGMPTVIMEAMASGLAILATNVGAVSKQVSEKNGIILEFPTPKLLRESIEFFVKMKDEDLLKMKKVSLLKVKENFLWSEVIKHNILDISKRIK